MSQAATMLEQYPAELRVDRRLLADAIDAALECFLTCTACADACLSEQDVASMTRCIRDDLDCADVCETTVKVLSRNAAYDAAVTRAQLRACIQACRTCGDSCDEHAAHMAHCATCAASCRSCERACRALLDAIGDGGDAPSSPQAAAPQG